MKIERIQIKNIGPYVDENCFKFDVSDLEKRMVLSAEKMVQVKPHYLTQSRFACMAALHMGMSPIMRAIMQKLRNS